MKVIVCLTSYNERLKNCSRSIFSILNGTYKDVKIVLTLYKDDIKFIPEDLKLLIDNNIVELIIAEENYEEFNKKFIVFKGEVLSLISATIKFKENILDEIEKHPEYIDYNVFRNSTSGTSSKK